MFLVSENGERACCGDKTYNVGSLECCNGMLNSVGTCPGSVTTPAPCACMNGGLCQTNGISTTCVCPSGYTGTYIDQSDSSIC